MRKTIRFRGQIQEIAASRVEAKIGAERYRAIKTLEPHPCFIELCVASTGESTGRVLGKGNVRKRWSEARIHELAQCFRAESFFAAPDLYDGHDAGNARRRSVGKLFEGWTAANKAFAFGVVTDRQVARAVNKGELDACSIEAAVEFRVDGDVWDVEGIDRSEGIAVALASSRDARPGFPGAGVVGVIQETEKGEAVTLEEMRAVVDRNGWGPEEVFGKEQLLSVGAVVDAMKAAERDAETRGRGDAERLRQELKSAQEALRPHVDRVAREQLRGHVTQSPALKDVPLGAVGYVMEKIGMGPAAEPDAAKRQAAVDAEAKRIMEEARAAGIAFGPAPADDGTATPGAGTLEAGRVDLRRREFNELIP